MHITQQSIGYTVGVMNASPVDLLAIISGFSIGLAGFAGIVTAVRGTQSEWNEAERFFAGNLITTSFFSGFVALFTLCVIGSLSEEWIWRTASAIQATAAILLLADAAYRSNKTPSTEMHLKEKVINSSIFTALGINLLAQIAVFFNYFIEAAFPIFYAGLVLHLLIAAINFYALIFRPAK